MTEKILNEDELNFFCKFIKDKSGITIGYDKDYLIESKLQPLLKKHNLPTIKDLISKIRTSVTPLNNEVVDAMTINESSFFRDSKPFTLLQQIIVPELLKTKKKINIWSAACSTGQEPYSIAITMEQNFKGKIEYELFATDLSAQVLEKAKQGGFSQFEIQRGMPITALVKFFTKLPDNSWQVKPELISKIKFQNLNLIQPFNFIEKFDIIFCRNVLIYFDLETKQKIFSKIADILSPTGFLILGGGETTLGISERFQIYQDNMGLYILK